MDRSGKTIGTIWAPDQNELTTVELSPDGQRVAVHRRVQNNTDIWLIDAARTTRFTFDPSLDQFPIWSHDGTRIVFDSNRTGQRNLYQKLAIGASSEELLLETMETKFANDWSPDNHFLLYGNGSGDLWGLPLAGAPKPFVFLKTSFQKRAGQFSPDGRWVAYQSNESGRVDIFVRSFPGPGGQWQISTAGGISEPYNRQQYDVAPDGRFLLNLVTNEAVASPITLLLNWNPPASN